MIGCDQEVRCQRHRLPRDHEQVRIVGHQHHEHGGEEYVVLQADQADIIPTALLEVAGGEQRDAYACRAEQEKKEGRQWVEPQVKRQIG